MFNRKLKKEIIDLKYRLVCLEKPIVFEVKDQVIALPAVTLLNETYITRGMFHGMVIRSYRDAEGYPVFDVLSNDNVIHEEIYQLHLTKSDKDDTTT